MKKTKQYLLNVAIFRTMLSAFVYFLMPIPAKWYIEYTGGEFIGYTMFGGLIMILFNIVIIVRSWVIALDKDVREDYLNND